MRQFFIIPLILLACSGAQAQQYYAQQTYPAPPQYSPQNAPGTVYAGQPTYAPQYPAGAVPQPHTQQPAPGEKPGEYGSSVMTDIRQMNF